MTSVSFLQPSVSENTSGMQLRIFDICGHLVLERTACGPRIQLSKQETGPGFFIYEITYASGKVETGRFVVE